MATDLSEPMAAWMAEHVASRESSWAARQAAKAAIRAERKAARDAGLKKRYALKAARIQQQASIT